MSQAASALGAVRFLEDTSAFGARRSPGGFLTTLALLALAWPALAAEEVRFTISNPARLPVAAVAQCGQTGRAPDSVLPPARIMG
jgi:hypothetical protein